jgi:predicted TIM-barrel fold metal-dependent hydrolase
MPTPCHNLHQCGSAEPPQKKHPEENMGTRRDFMKTAAAAAGVVFTGCNVPGMAHAQGARKQTIINGRRIKTIDIHAHCVIPEAVAATGRDPKTILAGTTRGSDELFIGAEPRLRAMDSQGIDIEALSINPTWYGLEREMAAKVVQLQNEKLAELCAAHPDRFVAFASLALQHPDLAVQQLETAVKKYNMRGAAIGGNVGNDEFANPKFNPVWAKAEELGVLLFIHPSSPPELANRYKGNGWLSNAIGNPLDTTIALSHLIFEGTLDKFPGLKICSAHGGGFLGSYAPRSDYSCMVSPSGCNPNIKLKKKPTEYLRQMYFDTLVFTPEALRHLATEVGVSQLMLGTDYPFPWQDKGVEHIMASPFTDEERIAMLSTTSAKLMGIKL